MTRVLSVVRAQARVLAAIALVEIVLAYGLGLLAARRIAAPLADHPDGTGVIFSDGGRVALELFFRREDALRGAIGLIGVGAVAYATVALILGAVLPRALGAPRRVAVVGALRDAARRAPTLLALAIIAGAGYALAGLLGWFCVHGAMRATAQWADARAADLWCLAAAMPALLGAWSVNVWHELARAHAVLDARNSALDAASAAGRRVVTTPRATMGTHALAVAAGLALLALETLAGGGLGMPRGALAVTLLVLLQLAIVAARLVVRAAWLAHVTRLWRDSAV